MTDQHQTEAQRLAALLRSRNNNQAGFGLGPVCDEAALELLRLNAVHADLERVSMQLVACGVVAMADTPDSAKKARAMHPDYESASCDDVKRRVDECIELRARVAELEVQLEFIGSRSGQFPDMVTLPRIVVEQALEAFDCIHSPLLIREIIKIGAEKAKLRAALEQPQDHVPDAGNMVPAGWKLVPLEPTDAMLGAGLRHVDGMTSMPSAYRDMLAAAPQPPAVERPQGEQEPVAGVVIDGSWNLPSLVRVGSEDSHIKKFGGNRLYTNPQPKREPLTDEQIGTPQTQKEKLVAVFTELGVGFECNDEVLVCGSDMPGNDGYSGFEAEFNFDSEGRFTKLGIWE